MRREEGKTVIAGYPWFLDWGRDTLICARGYLAAGHHGDVKDLLRVFGRFEEAGTLPNIIHGDDVGNRDTVDAPLWYGVVAEEYAQTVSEDIYACELVDGRRIEEVLCSIAGGYLDGASNGVCVDPKTCLVWSPSHFTWMDTNYPAGTPRKGYPLEIQALWIRLLRQLAERDLPATKHGAWQELAERAAASFDSLFWLPDHGWWSDCLLADSGTGAEKGGGRHRPALQRRVAHRPGGEHRGTRPLHRLGRGQVIWWYPAPCAALPPCPSSLDARCETPRASCSTIRNTPIKGTIRARKTASANRPTTTAPPGPGPSQDSVKPW